MRAKRITIIFLLSVFLLTLLSCAKKQIDEDEIFAPLPVPTITEPVTPQQQDPASAPGMNPDAAQDDGPAPLPDPSFSAAYAATDGKAVYWIYTDATGQEAPYMVLYAWEDLSAEEAVIAPSSQEISLQSLLKAGESAPAAANELPEDAQGAPLVSIAAEAFSGCSLLRRIRIPDTVTEIGDGAFRGCSALSEIELPPALTLLGAEAFQNCTSLPAIRLQTEAEGLSLGSGCFSGCTGLREVLLAIALDEIPARCFENCSSLSAIQLPEGTKYIAYRAFAGCIALKALPFPEGLLYIGQYAFSGSGLSAVTLPEGILEIGSYAFSETPMAELPGLPESLTLLGAKPFDGTPAMEAAFDADGFAVLRCGRVFLVDYRGKAAEVTVPDGVEIIGSECFRGLAIRQLTLPASVREIDEAAFQECSSLLKADLGGTVKIGSYAFLSCGNLKQIQVSSALESIGYDAFWRCGALETLELSESVREIDETAFEHCGALTVRCPAGSYAASRCAELSIPTETK